MKKFLKELLKKAAQYAVIQALIELIKFIISNL